MQRASAGIHPNGMLRAAIVREVTLKSLHFPPQHVLAAVQDAQDRRVDFLFDALVLRPQINQRNHTTLVTNAAPRGGRVDSWTGSRPQEHAPLSNPPARRLRA